MIRRALAVVVLVACAVACGGDADDAAGAPAPDAPTEAATGPAGDRSTAEPATAETEADAGTEPAPSAAPLRPVRVRIYFPAADATELVGEDRDIFDTSAPEDRAKQILSDLLEGPQGRDKIAAVPPGVRLRQVYVLPDGTAYADFSIELRDLLGGGSAQELMTVYAIVDSVALNVHEIRRLGILIDGAEIETLSGHLDLRRPVTPRTDLIRGAQG